MLSRTRPTRRARCRASRATRCTRATTTRGRSRSGPTISCAAHADRRRGGNAACLQCHEPSRANVAAHTHHARRFLRQLLLQLPHAVHDLRPAEDDPQPSDQQPIGAGDARHRPAQRVQPVSSRQDARVDRRRAAALVRDAAPALDADEQSVAASLLWLLKGDAGQRAIVAQSMGWPRRSRRRAPSGWRRTWRSSWTIRTMRCGSAPRDRSSRSWLRRRRLSMWLARRRLAVRHNFGP